MWVVDWTSNLQEHKGLIQFEKLYLNLCSLRWFSPTRNLESSFKPTRLCMLQHELGTDRPNFSRAFLKDNKLLALRICKPSLFHSEIVYGKINLWKHLFCNGMFLGLPHLIGYYKNDFTLGCIVTDTV